MHFKKRIGKYGYISLSRGLTQQLTT